MVFSKRVWVYIHPDAVSFFKHDVKINDWIEEQVPLYQGLNIRPVKGGHVLYVPSIKVKCLMMLHDIPGRTPSRKLNNLYWDMIMRNEKKQRRYDILHRLFPKR